MDRSKIAVRLSLLLIATVLVTPGPARAEDFCGPMDVAFVIDTTGSMHGAIANVAAEAASLLGDIDTASGGDDQLSLLTFKDTVTVNEDLAAGNDAAVNAAILGLTAGGGANLAEASDEALNTAINGLDAADRLGGEQTGDFNGAWRAGAVKIVILITDAPPGGFDDAHDAPDDANAAARAAEAAAAGILISAVFVPTAGDYDGQVAIMQSYASTTGGVYLETADDGTGTAAAIASIIEACGSANEPPDCSGAAPSLASLWPPNHAAHDVAVLGVSDPEGSTTTVTITSIFQDEVVDAPGNGDGNTAPDGWGVGTSTATVLAQRAGNGDGRVYHIGFTADDGNGGACSGTVSVQVPHAVPTTPAVDGGALYDSTVG